MTNNPQLTANGELDAVSFTSAPASVRFEMARRIEVNGQR